MPARVAAGARVPAGALPLALGDRIHRSRFRGLSQDTSRREYSLLENQVRSRPIWAAGAGAPLTLGHATQLRRLEKKRDELVEEKRLADLDPKQMHRMLLERVRQDTAFIKEGKGRLSAVTAENGALAQVGCTCGLPFPAARQALTSQRPDAESDRHHSAARGPAEERRGGRSGRGGAGGEDSGTGRGRAGYWPVHVTEPTSRHGDAPTRQQLRARDQHMQRFISSFPEEEAAWRNKKEKASGMVVALLEHIGENIQRSQSLPSCVSPPLHGPHPRVLPVSPRSDSRERVEDMKDELEFKDQQLHASKSTSASPWRGKGEGSARTPRGP